MPIRANHPRWIPIPTELAAADEGIAFAGPRHERVGMKAHAQRASAAIRRLRSQAHGRRAGLARAPDGSVTLVAENVRAVAVLYFASALEEARFFDVTERIVDLFNQGALPSVRGASAKRLYQYWKSGSSRLTETQRRELYARAFGTAAGDPAGTAELNRAFDGLWMEFLSSVDGYMRTSGPRTTRARKSASLPDTGEVKSRARALAANLSEYGGGSIPYAARDLRDQVDQATRIVSDIRIRNAFGARDPWEVIDHVARVELGVEVNVGRHRDLAESGSTIINWLAGQSRLLEDERSLQLPSSMYRVRRSLRRRIWILRPTKEELIEAVRVWLAVHSSA